MNYAQAVDHLYALGPELAPLTGAAKPLRKFDLAHMRALCRELGNPQDRVPSVLIAGTNGKGSTAATLAAILTAAGYRTGLYTSPHLVRINERIQLSDNGVLQPIADDDFASYYARVDDACERLVAAHELAVVPSFFERVTAIAFLYYAERPEPVDILVLEVGLGGRLDATNVVEPLLSIITDIALDHQEYLGNTIREIAGEKCGILRPGGTLVTLAQHQEANQAIGDAAAALGVRGVNAADYLPPAVRNDAALVSGTAAWRNQYQLHVDGVGLLSVDSPLGGQHQQRNIALAIATAIELRNQNGYKITNTTIEQGIRNTVWPGRLELIAPGLLLDVAHNPAGAWTLRGAISSLPESQPRTLIFSCLRDKNLAEMSRILFSLFDSSADGDPLRRNDHLILAPIVSPRATDIADLVSAAEALGVPAIATADVAEALATARRVTPSDGLIIATGSVYLIGEIRQLVLQDAGRA
jgi:dihydrofolate synthase / folylpolyglutamate synthase